MTEQTQKPLLFIDMDNVLVDFKSGLEKVSEEIKQQYECDEKGKPHYDDIPDCDMSDPVEMYKDIQIRHNETTDDHLNIVVDAVRRRMQQVAQQLVDEGLAENVESVRFALQYGPIYGCQYCFDLNADEFDPEALRPIDCTDWNDCHVSDVLQEHWPDRLVGSLIYNGIFYAGECEGVDSFEWNCDLVDSDLNSLL